MAAAGEIYSESSSDILASILRKINQELVYAESLQNPVSDTEQLSIGRTVESETQTNDSMSGGLSRQETDQFYMPLEPYPNLKAWLKFDSGITIKDYAYNNTICKSEVVKNSFSPQTKRPIKRTVTDDATTEGPVYSITNGLNQFFRIENSAHLKIQNILNNSNIFELSMVVSPMFYYTPQQGTDWADALCYIDNEQADNGVRISISGDGKVRFKLLWNNQPYELETAADAVARLYNTPYQTSYYQSSVFQTEGLESPQQNPDVDPTDWTQLTFVFNKTTRVMTIKKTDMLGVTTTLATSTSESGIRTTFKMHLPLNDGGETNIAKDATGNGHDGIFDSDNPPSWTAQNTLKFDGPTEHVTIPNHADINNLSVFTVALKIKVNSWSSGVGQGNHEVIFGKNLLGEYSQQGGFMFFLPHSGSQFVAFDFINQNNTYSWIDLLGPVTAGVWHNYIWTYDGTTHNLYIDGVQQVPFNRAGDVFTSTTGYIIGNDVKCGNVEVADVIVDKGTAWGTSQRSWFNARTAGFKSDWPVAYPPPPPPNDDPVVLTAPWSKLYDVPKDPVSTKALRLNNPQAASPFVAQYTIPAGVDVVDAEVERYNVPDGTQGAQTQNPWYTAYSLTPQNSTGTLTSDEKAVGEYVRTTGSNIYNRKLTEIGVYLKYSSGSQPTGGTIYVAIILADGSYIPFGTGFSPSALTTSWALFTRQNFTAQHPVLVGEAVGIVWIGGTSGTINIQRGGSTYYEDASLSCQAKHDGTEWGNPNPDYAIAGLFRYGGETVAGSNPYFKMGSTNYVAATYQINSTVENTIISRAVWRVRRVGSAPSAVVNCYILNTAGTAVATLGGPISFNSISTTVQDLEFITRGNAVAWADGYRVVINLAPRTGIDNVSNYLEVNYNIGSPSGGYVGGTSIKAQYWTGAAYADVNPACDWAGKLYSGGASFTAWWALGDGHRTKAGIVVNDATAVTAGKKFSKFDVTMKKQGSPTGPIVLKIYQKVGANYELRATFNTILAESLTTVSAVYPFTNVLNAYQTAANDIISVEYSGGDANNYVLINVNTNTAAGAAGDTTKTCFFDFYDGLYFIKTDLDLGGCIAYTGGVPDLVSRSKRAVVCNSEEAPIRAKRITSAKFYARRVGTISGQLKLTIVRGSDYTTVRTMHAWDASLVPLGPTWTTYFWDDPDNAHFMGLSDKIAVEFEGGDSNNYIEVQYVDHNVGEGAYTEDISLGDYDGISWHNDETKYLGGDAWTGGYTYIQDPSVPPVPEPYHYDHDWRIGAGGFVDAETPPTTYYGMRIRDLKISDVETSSAGLSHFMENKYTTSDILLGQVGLCGYCNADEVDT